MQSIRNMFRKKLEADPRWSDPKLEITYKKEGAVEIITLHNLLIKIDPEPRGSLADYLKTYST